MSWSKVKLAYFYLNNNLDKWVSWLVNALIFFLPFEQILVLQFFGATIKPAQVITLILLFILVLKFLNWIKTTISSNRSNHWNFDFIIFLWLFWLTSSLSWFLVVDFNRFLINFLATTICILTVTMIGFLGNFKNLIAFKYLIYCFWGLSFFAWYQFFGDLFGLDSSLTLLRPQYTKIIFGIPRVHTTTLEPLFWSGMLVIPWFYYFWKITLTLIQDQKDYPVKPGYYFSLFYFSLCFLLPFAKSSILVLGILITCIFIYLVFLLKSKIRQTLSKLPKKLLAFSFVSIGCLFIVSGFLPTFQTAYTEIFKNFYQTFTGESTSAIERSRFFEAGIDLLKETWPLGIGPGQYGVLTRYQLGDLNPDPNNYAVVNNTYLEIILEHGFLAFCFFVIFFICLIVKLFKKLHFNLLKKHFSNSLVVGLSSFCSLLFYLGQISFFSPLYYMPVFILTGICLIYLRN